MIDINDTFLLALPTIQSVSPLQVADEFNYESDKDIYKELFKEDMEHRGGSVR